jgi:hypothetical protein
LERSIKLKIDFAFAPRMPPLISYPFYLQGLTTGDINLSAILSDNDTKPQDDSVLGNNPAIGEKDK